MLEASTGTDPLSRIARASRGLALALVLFVALLTAGCGRQDPHLHIVAIVDMTGSMEPGAQKQEFDVLEKTARSLQRGDSFTVVPVLGDEDVDAPGKVLRFNFALPRQAYDNGLRELALRVRSKLQTEKQWAVAHPAAHTDLLGALDIASQEVSAQPSGGRPVLIVLSDMIEDTPELTFPTSPDLRTAGTAQKLAERLAVRDLNRFRAGMPVYLDLVRSRDLALLSSSRRAAIGAFWVRYLAKLGAVPELVIDGPGLLPPFLQDVRRKTP